jgi:hypothetical protein
MKKTLLAVLLAMVLPVMAQTTPTAPAAGSPAPMITVSDTAFAAGVTSALSDPNTNIVYLNQTGVNPIVNITQDGAGNRVGADATGGINPVVLSGSNQTVTIIQSGQGQAAGYNNVIDTLKLYTTSGASSVTIQQLGSSNTINATCGSGANCNNANINWKFQGDNNSLNFTGRGDSLISGINVTGNGNTFVSQMTGDNHSQLVNVNGSDNNTFNLTQTSSSPSNIVITQNGMGGTAFNISQTGSYSGVANIQATSAGGSFNITQRGR